MAAPEFKPRWSPSRRVRVAVGHIRPITRSPNRPKRQKLNMVSTSHCPLTTPRCPRYYLKSRRVSNPPSFPAKPSKTKLCPVRNLDSWLPAESLITIITPLINSPTQHLDEQEPPCCNKPHGEIHLYYYLHPYLTTGIPVYLITRLPVYLSLPTPVFFHRC